MTGITVVMVGHMTLYALGFASVGEGGRGVFCFLNSRKNYYK